MGDFCNICVDETKDFVTCNWCQERACVDCVEHWLLEQPVATCMYPKCKRLWNDYFIWKQLPFKFYDVEYRKHKSQQLFIKEQALLLQTQELMKTYSLTQKDIDRKLGISNDDLYSNLQSFLSLVNPEFSLQDVTKDEIMEFIENISNIYYYIRKMGINSVGSYGYKSKNPILQDVLNMTSCKYRDEREERGIDFGSILEFIMKINSGYNDMRIKNIHLRAITPKQAFEMDERNEFTIQEIIDAKYHHVLKKDINARSNSGKNIKGVIVYPCERRECRGFVKNNTCGMCDIIYCEFCRKEKDKDKDKKHTCNKDEVETVNMLKEKSRLCPKCSALIIKQDGCDHMWCVMCHASFNWATGRIRKGAPANPHYYEYMREKNLSIESFTPCEDHAKGKTNEEKEAIRIGAYIKSTKKRTLPITSLTNLDLRISFLKGEITKSKFLSQIKNRIKKMEKEKEIDDIIDMFVACISDIVSCNLPTYKFLNMFKSLITYFNSLMENVSLRFKNKQFCSITQSISVLRRKDKKFDILSVLFE